jgi:quinol monooxygenase YgiN
MIALVVSLQVRPRHRDQFLEAIERNAYATFNDEPGCVYFDVTCDQADDHHFFFYEVYVGEAAVALHRQQDHFHTWRRAAEEHVVPGSQVNTLTDRLLHHG